MPRDHGRVLSSIWRDPDFRALSPEAQRMYLMLISQSSVNNAGVLPLQIGKLAKGCDSTTDDDVWRALNELSRTDFAYFDDDTEEVFIRSYIRNDGVLKQPNILKNALRCALVIESDYLRAAMAVELRRLGRVDADEKADVLDQSGTAPEVFREAHARVVDAQLNPSETLPEPFPQFERVSEPLSNPAGKGKGKGKGESLVGTHSPSSEKKQAPAKLDAAKPKAIEQAATERAYDRVGKAFNFMAVRQMAKWAIHDRGADPQTVEDAIVAVYEMGKPVTRQVLGQYLDGHFSVNRATANGQSRADQKVQGYLDMAARLTSHPDSPKEITR